MRTRVRDNGVHGLLSLRGNYLLRETCHPDQTRQYRLAETVNSRSQSDCQFRVKMAGANGQSRPETGELHYTMSFQWDRYVIKNLLV